MCRPWADTRVRPYENTRVRPYESVWMFRRKCRHREGARPIGIDSDGRAETVCSHQRAEAREERRELFGRRLRARVERVLHDAARRRIDDDGDAIDGRLDRVRLEVEERERAQRTHLAYRCRQFQAPDRRFPP